LHDLTVTEAPPVANLDGVPYQLDSKGYAHALLLLLEAAQAEFSASQQTWVTYQRLHDECGDLTEHATRFMAKYPQPVRDLIESKPGKGYRLNLVIAS
jgi:hypothetical protein